MATGNANFFEALEYVPPFDENEMCPSSYIQTCKRAVKLFRLSEDELPDFLCLLENKFSKIIRLSLSLMNICNFDEFEETIRDSLRLNRSPKVIRNCIENCFMAQNENLQQYKRRIEMLHSELIFVERHVMTNQYRKQLERDAITSFLDGLPEEIRLECKLSPHETLYEAYRNASKIYDRYLENPTRYVLNSFAKSVDMPINLTENKFNRNEQSTKDQSQFNDVRNVHNDSTSKLEIMNSNEKCDSDAKTNVHSINSKRLKRSYEQLDRYSCPFCCSNSHKFIECEVFSEYESYYKFQKSQKESGSHPSILNPIRKRENQNFVNNKIEKKASSSCVDFEIKESNHKQIVEQNDVQNGQFSRLNTFEAIDAGERKNLYKAIDNLSKLYAVNDSNLQESKDTISESKVDLYKSSKNQDFLTKNKLPGNGKALDGISKNTLTNKAGVEQQFSTYEDYKTNSIEQSTIFNNEINTDKNIKSGVDENLLVGINFNKTQLFSEQGDIEKRLVLSKDIFNEKKLTDASNDAGVERQDTDIKSNSFPELDENSSKISQLSIFNEVNTTELLSKDRVNISVKLNNCSDSTNRCKDNSVFYLTRNLESEYNCSNHSLLNSKINMISNQSCSIDSSSVAKNTNQYRDQLNKYENSIYVICKRIILALTNSLIQVIGILPLQIYPIKLQMKETIKWFRWDTPIT